MLDGKVYGGSRGVAAELGHLRPGLQADRPEMTVEAAASGWGIAAAAAQARLFGSQVERPTCKMVAQAAAEGNVLAREIFHQAVRTLGWAVAQMITLSGAERGGDRRRRAALAGEALFFAPLREEVDRYVFPRCAAAFASCPPRWAKRSWSTAPWPWPPLTAPARRSCRKGPADWPNRNLAAASAPRA